MSLKEKKFLVASTKIIFGRSTVFDFIVVIFDFRNCFNS